VTSQVKEKHKVATSAIPTNADFYAVMGVPATADLETIKKACRDLMRACHPNTTGVTFGDKTASNNFIKIQMAYKCLSDPWERYVYDYLGMDQYLARAKMLSAFKSYAQSGGVILEQGRNWIFSTRYRFWFEPDGGDCIMIGRKVNLEPSPSELLKITKLPLQDIVDITQTGTRITIATKEAPGPVQYRTSSEEQARFFANRLSLIAMDAQKNRVWMEKFYSSATKPPVTLDD
jgi:curved DNA-binding protein CbpA